MSYLAQSSYWVYEIHMPATAAVSLLSYHLLVRSTPLGSLLNGRRYPFTLFGGMSRATPS